MRTGTGPQAWIVLLYRGSCSRIMDHEVALPLRALRRGGGMDVFVTTADIDQATVWLKCTLSDIIRLTWIIQQFI